MFRRVLLILTFLATFATVGVALNNSAHAWDRWGWRRPYVAYYGAGPRPYYSGYTPYQAYYYGPRVYRPFYGRYYYGNPYYYGDPYYDYYGPRGRVAFSIGF
jgi:hypothetical protein